MSPDDQWVKWIAFAAAIIQTLAALIQLRRQSGAADSASPSTRGISSGVKLGLAALVFELFGWLLATGAEIESTLWRLVGYSPAILLAGLAFFVCVGELIAKPEPPEPPHPMNAPISGRTEFYRLEMERRQNEYHRALMAARMLPSHAFSLLMSGVVGLAVAYTSLLLAGAIG